MIPAMGIDSYWRTRTIAEGQSQGYSHLRAVCSGVRAGPDIPWLLLPRRPSISGDSFIGDLPLRCQRCCDTAPIIGVRQNARS